MRKRFTPFWGLERRSSRSESFACEWRSREESVISVLFSCRGTALLLALIVFGTAAAFRIHGLDAHWSSDEARWLNRSAQFMSAVKKGEFSDTLIAYHPGVPTMWLAGLRTFFMESNVDVENLAASAVVHRHHCMDRDRYRLPPTLPTLWKMDSTCRGGVSCILTAFFSTNTSRPYRCTRHHFYSVDSPFVSALLSRTPPPPVSHLFRCRFRACIAL